MVNDKWAHDSSSPLGLSMKQQLNFLAFKYRQIIVIWPQLIKVKLSQELAAQPSEIREIVLAHRADNASVFGSVAKGLDSEESDLDILVDPTPDTTLYG